MNGYMCHVMVKNKVTNDIPESNNKVIEYANSVICISSHIERFIEMVLIPRDW